MESLDYVNQNIGQLYEEDNDYFLHTYAMYLLAEFREKAAFQKLVLLLHMSDDYIDYVIGDSLGDSFPRILCSTFDREHISLLKDVIENQELYEYARSAAIHAYALLYKAGFITEEEIITYFRELIHVKLTDDYSCVPTFLANDIIDIKLIQMIPDVRLLYNRGDVDKSVCGEYDSFLDYILSDRDFERNGCYIDNTVEEMECWACFKTEHSSVDPKKSDKNFMDGLEKIIKNGIKEDKKMNQAAIQKHKKVGRNDPCPC